MGERNIVGGGLCHRSEPSSPDALDKGGGGQICAKAVWEFGNCSVDWGGREAEEEEEEEEEMALCGEEMEEEELMAEVENYRIQSSFFQNDLCIAGTSGWE